MVDNAVSRCDEYDRRLNERTTAIDKTSSGDQPPGRQPSERERLVIGLGFITLALVIGPQSWLVPILLLIAVNVFGGRLKEAVNAFYDACQ